MDLSPLLSLITTKLSHASPLESLELQNHLYGCFILMEDIAQQTVELRDRCIVSSSAPSFSLLNQFHQIGSVYGFLNDQHVILHSVSPDYLKAWMEVFESLQQTHSIEQVDAMEDAILQLLHEKIPPSFSFFTEASKTGSLPHEWVLKALALLHPNLFPSVSNDPPKETPLTEEEAATPSALTRANPENKMHPSSHPYVKKKVRFDQTRRQIPKLPSKGFSKTRRQILTS